MKRNRYPGIRPSGEGSWELKFDLPRDATGKRRTRFVTFKGTKAEAAAERDRLKSEGRKGGFIDPSKVTVAEFINRWDSDWASLHVSAKTLERYREILAHHVVPHIGGTAIQKLRPVHLSELYAKLLREGGKGGKPLSGRTVGHVHRVLHRVMGHAAQWDIVQTNIVSLVDPPPVIEEEIEILSPDQIQTVLTKLRGYALYLPAALALASGARRGELLALRWSDVDMDKGSIRIERSLEQTKAKGLQFKSPKTRHGRRTITLPASIVTELRAHWKAQQEHRLALGLGKAPGDALVMPLYDGSPRKPNALTKEWKRTVAALGLPAVNFHALRHTHASQLIASGLDVVTVSRRLGHGSPAITLKVYAHMFAATDDRAAQVLEATFAKSRTD